MDVLKTHLQCRRDDISNLRTYRETGSVDEISGVLVSARLKRVRIGELCRIMVEDAVIPAEVIGYREGRCLLMPFGHLDGLVTGADVVPSGNRFRITCGPWLLGSVLDGLGRPFDSIEPETKRLANKESGYAVDVMTPAPHPMDRQRIHRPLLTGVAAIDAFLTLGNGQRVGIFAAAGTGKSTLLGTLARSNAADVVVVNLVGERGREVREFIEDNLDDSGRRRAVVVAATSDQPAIIRLKSAYVATAIAEYFRDQGQNVLLIMDSVTRFARALREIG
nr:EscN/YscN/HrcN family type III secretion system ATPase [bacterium]